VLLCLIAVFKYIKKQIDDQNRSISEEIEKEYKVESDLKLEFLTQVKMLKLYGWEHKF
jgi:ribosomal protein S13